jgi:uncharacterized membrane protein YphA (DoxX/SURF4 family)
LQVRASLGYRGLRHGSRKGIARRPRSLPKHFKQRLFCHYPIFKPAPFLRKEQINECYGDYFTATFIGGLEIVGGLLLLAGLTTRLFAIPFIAEMIVAILSTKISLYLGTSPLPLPPAPPQVGFWAVLHEIRSEYAQMLTVMFLMVNGPGNWSLDAVLHKARKGGVSEFVPSGRRRDLAAATSR